jgi:hypothetical protein
MVTGCLLFGFSSAFANSPTQYETVVQALESTKEFLITDGTLKFSEGNPDKIEIVITVFPGDINKVIEEETMRSLVFAFIVVFAQTDVQKLKIKAIPAELNFKTKKQRLLKKKSLSATISRKKMNRLLKQYVGIDSCQSLIGDMYFGNEVIHDMLLEKSDCIMYNDQGKPGLKRFFSEMN